MTEYRKQMCFGKSEMKANKGTKEIKTNGTNPKSFAQERKKERKKDRKKERKKEGKKERKKERKEERKKGRKDERKKMATGRGRIQTDRP